MQLLPFIVIIIGAFFIVRFAKSSGRKLSPGFLWFLSIVVPFVFQVLAVMILHPNELAVTKLDWFLVDNFQMRLSNAQFLTDLICRTLGAVIGIAIVTLFVFLRDRKSP
jgi:hypothetical protein